MAESEQKSEASILQDLRRDAERAFGPDRAEAMLPFLQTSATALWRLSQTTLDALDDPPNAFAMKLPND
jgi:hypothetical protein